MNKIEEIKKKALEEEIPIMEEEGMAFLCDLIREQKPSRILEIGTAVGYSALRMKEAYPDARIVTLEKDRERYQQALENIRECGYEDAIQCLCADAREISVEGPFDLLFLDGAKGIIQVLFDQYAPLVVPGGYIVIDDVDLHNFVAHPETIRSRRLRVLVKRLSIFREKILKDPAYQSEYYPIGDGIIVAVKK